MCSLSNMYSHGEGVDQNFTTAVGYITKAALLGDPSAQASE
jgi:TPR repeat protein